MTDQSHDAPVKDNLSRQSTWLRLVYMLVLAIAWAVTEVIFVAVVVLQFLSTLFSGRPLEHLTSFGRSLALYMAQIVRFETFVTEDLAFPFAAWPSAPAEDPLSTSVQPLAKVDTKTSQADQNEPQTTSRNEERAAQKKPRARRSRKTDPAA